MLRTFGDFQRFVWTPFTLAQFHCCVQHYFYFKCCSNKCNFFQEFWYYEEVSAKEGKYGHRMTQRIPTLEEWLNQFGHDPRIRLIWLDVKVNVESKLKFFTDRLISLLNKFHITKDRLQFSVREVKIGALLQVNLKLFILAVSQVELMIYFLQLKVLFGPFIFTNVKL